MTACGITPPTKKNEGKELAEINNLKIKYIFLQSLKENKVKECELNEKKNKPKKKKKTEQKHTAK